MIGRSRCWSRWPRRRGDRRGRRSTCSPMCPGWSPLPLLPPPLPPLLLLEPTGPDVGHSQQSHARRLPRGLGGTTSRLRAPDDDDDDDDDDDEDEEN